ncbi:MAG TPA: hypothetical protein VLL50_08810 [Usitatibacter sp.]|nr:hypothetical protein [Usitatibacter sp.]
MFRSRFCCIALALSFAIAPVNAQSEASRASEASLLPVATVSMAPGFVLAAGASLTVIAVEETADGTVWLVERTSDGARASLHVAGQVVGGASQAVGSAITVTAVSAGCILSMAGRAIAFVPNEVGAALLHTRKVPQ